MSFYSYRNEGNEQCPGRIGFEGLRKIRKKSAFRLIRGDSCLQQETLKDVKVTLSNVCGSGFQALELISCEVLQ